MMRLGHLAPVSAAMLLMLANFGAFDGRSRLSGIARADTVNPASSPAALQSADGHGACPLPSTLAEAHAELPATARVLRERGTLNVLAIGSALIARRAPADQSVPEQVGRLLQAQFPGATVNVRMVSQHGALATELASSIAKELGKTPAQLVLWQTGTVEAARKASPETFAQALADGIRAARANGADVVLIDPIYSRMLQSRTDVAPYEAVFTAAVATSGTMLFPRYALVQHWVETGVVDAETAPKRDRRKAMNELHDCLAAALTSMIAARVDAPDRPASSP